MPRHTHTLAVGRFTVAGEYDAVLLEYDNSWGMRDADLGRLELQAAIAVFQTSESVNGEELQFARKAMGLRKPELATLLDVSQGTFSRWETGEEPVQRQAQLAVLRLLEQTPVTGASPVRIVSA